MNDNQLNHTDILDDPVISTKVIYNKSKIVITELTHKSGDITYTGENLKKNALRTYIQYYDLEVVKNYIISDLKKKVK